MLAFGLTAPAHAELDDTIEVKAALPWVKAEAIEIAVNNGVLSIKAEHRDEEVEKRKNYHMCEIRYAAYRRSLRLPTLVDSDCAEASLADGMLSLRLPKAEAVRPKQIKIAS